MEDSECANTQNALMPQHVGLLDVRVCGEVEGKRSARKALG